MTPFLSIITRTCRPAMLARCKASVKAQHDRDFEHVLLVDDVGRGVNWANRRLHEERDRAQGQYVYVLDDDVVLTDPYFTSDIHAIARAYAPDVVMCKADLLQFGILPDWRCWKQTPQWGRVDMACFVVKADVWRAHSAAFTENYEADYDFISDVFTAQPRVYWHDKVVARAQAISRGAIATPMHEICWQILRDKASLTLAKRLLYVGANRCAPPMYAGDLAGAGVRVELLEIWTPNVAYYRAKPGPFVAVRQGDVRLLGTSDLDGFDAALWWHGPEHIDKKDLADALKQLQWAATIVAVGCPWGLYVQGANDGNPSEVHQATIYPEDLAELGFETYTVGNEGDGHIVAWWGPGSVLSIQTYTPEVDIAGLEDCYVKTNDCPTFWLVQNGKRRVIPDARAMYVHGLRPVVVVKPWQLVAVPVEDEA